MTPPRPSSAGNPSGRRLTVVHLTPGAGQTHCAGCFRDNTLVLELRRMGHDVLMVPLYLPLRLEDVDASRKTPVFFSGLNVYLDQRWPWFRRAPRLLHRLLARRALLGWVGRWAAKTQPAEVGELTLSMLRGEEGHQAREIEELVAWLKTQPPPNVICFSNALLLGMARRLRQVWDAPMVCTFQGEDGFVDAMPADARGAVWTLMRERAAEVDCFIAPSRYAADLMRQRLALPAERVRVIANGIRLEGYGPAPAPPAVPTLGFFARMGRAKGIDVVVDAFFEIRKRRRVPGLRLRLGGSLGSADQPLIADLRRRIEREGAGAEVDFCPNLDPAAKLEFLRSLTVMSVPARAPEVFGFYLLEALACGVPVVQPRQGAYVERIEGAGGGLLYEPNDAAALAGAVEPLLIDPARARALGETGRKAIQSDCSAERMARRFADVYAELCRRG
ncbi:MAG: glycosyltransferase family 4 protein [Verrucomicrobia bacterium]|nr:glycosyltransferase family 4 protein [Verrucomicrobiota bacterium]